MEDKRVKIGEVDVESGQLVICDPCMIEKSLVLNNYASLLKIRQRLIIEAGTKSPLHDQIYHNKGKKEFAVVFDPGVGDGTYEVWATIGRIETGGVEMGERIKKIEMEFIK